MSLIYVGFKSPVSLIETTTAWDIKRHPRVSAEVVAGGVDFAIPNHRRVHVPNGNIAYAIFTEQPPTMTIDERHEELDARAPAIDATVPDPPSVPDANTARSEPPPLNRGQVLGKLGIYDPKTGALEKPCSICGGVAMPIKWAKSAGIEGTAHHEDPQGKIGCRGTVREFLAKVS